MRGKGEREEPMKRWGTPKRPKDAKGNKVKDRGDTKCVPDTCYMELPSRQNHITQHAHPTTGGARRRRGWGKGRRNGGEETHDACFFCSLVDFIALIPSRHQRRFPGVLSVWFLPQFSTPSFRS